MYLLYFQKKLQKLQFSLSKSRKLDHENEMVDKFNVANNQNYVLKISDHPKFPDEHIKFLFCQFV